MTADKTYYIGRAGCGCIRGVMVNNPEHKRDVAKNIASWIRSGLTVELMTSEEWEATGKNEMHSKKNCPHTRRENDDH